MTRPYCLPQRPSLRSNSGESLLSVLVAIGIAIAAAVGYLQFKVASRQTMSSVQSGRSLEEVEGPFREYLWRVMLNHTNRRYCNPNELTADYDSLLIGTLGAPRMILRPPALASDAPPSHAAAAARCGEPRLPSNNSTSAYFCLQILRAAGSTVEPTSFYNNNNIFAEVHYRFLNFATGSPVACNRVNNYYEAQKHTYGAQITYTLYWSKTLSPNHFAYKERHGTFTAGE